MHRFSPFCPTSIDGNISRDSFLWTEKAAILPDITYFWCGAPSVWSLKCWITSHSPSPPFQVNLHCLVTCNLSPAEPPPVSCPETQKSLQSPGGNAWWDVLLQGNSVLQWNHSPPHSSSTISHLQPSTLSGFYTLI